MAAFGGLLGVFFPSLREATDCTQAIMFDCMLNPFTCHNSFDNRLNQLADGKFGVNGHSMMNQYHRSVQTQNIFTADEDDEEFTTPAPGSKAQMATLLVGVIFLCMCCCCCYCCCGCCVAITYAFQYNDNRSKRDPRYPMRRGFDPYDARWRGRQTPERRYTPERWPRPWPSPGPPPQGWSTTGPPPGPPPERWPAPGPPPQGWSTTGPPPVPPPQGWSTAGPPPEQFYYRKEYITQPAQHGGARSKIQSKIISKVIPTKEATGNSTVGTATKYTIVNSTIGTATTTGNLPTRPVSKAS